jgi:hypothetical protein
MDNTIRLADTFSKVKEIERNDFIKGLAMLLMVIDHVGLTFFPHITLFRIIGRLAFPMFAYGIASGYVHTKSIRKYSTRLFILALVSQPIFRLLIPEGLNIFFTLLVGLILIYSIDKQKYWLTALMIGFSFIMPLDYGIYGVGTILAFYIFRDNLLLMAIAQCFLNGIFALNYHTLLQAYSLFALPLIYIKWNLNIKLNRYFAYLFYPLHLAIIEIILYIK